MKNNEDLLSIFLEEAKDLLDALAGTLQAWSLDLNNKNYFAPLKRDLHTLKGGARMVNQSELSALAHELESLVDSLSRENTEINRESYDLICRGQDRLNAMLEAIAKKGKITSVTEDTPLETKNEVIRVSADVLEKMNNISIESNIIRVNLEHSIDNFKTYMDNIHELIKSLQSKIRRIPNDVNLQVDSEMQMLINIYKNLIQLRSNMESLLTKQGRLALELQDELVNTRLVPFNSVAPRLSRIARQVALELNKKIDFNILSSEGEIDRNILEQLIPSLEHLLRNAIDHGIESLEKRIQLEKPEMGKITLKFFRTGSDIGIEISDDGQGISAESVRKKAIQLGLISSNMQISDQDIIRMILEPGFSTSETINEISGRGIGMDVVNTIVKGLGGNLKIESKLGIGSQFTLRLPFTTSMNRALLVVVQGQTYGVLLSNVKNIILLKKEQVETYLNEKMPVLKYENKNYHLKYLGASLYLKKKPLYLNLTENMPVLLFDFADYKAAIIVDRLAGSQEVVVQTLGPQFKLMDTFSGASLLADGKVIIVLDMYSIITKITRISDPNFENGYTSKENSEKLHTILVVDDSLTVRDVTKNFLEQKKYAVITAKDGLEALEKLKNNKIDLILLDLEMPRMDGFQFAEALRKNLLFSSLPIIMITFSAGLTQIRRAKALGIQKFMSKPYHEPELLEAIEALLEQEA